MTEISHRCYKDDLKGDVPPTERMIIFLSCSQDSEVCVNRRWIAKLPTTCSTKSNIKACSENS